VEANSKGHNKKKGALKTNNNRGTISPAMAFVGPHPDAGTMRILTQGVETLAPGGRPKITVTLHPDTTFAGAHANLMRVLHLEGTNQTGVDSAHRRGGGGASVHGASVTSDAHGEAAGTGGAGASCKPPNSHAIAAGAAAAGAAHGPDDSGQQHLRSPADAAMSDDGRAAAGGAADVDDDDHQSDQEHSRSDGGESDSDHSKGPKDGSEDLEAQGQAKLHSRAASKSDFVAQWVRTLTNKTSGALEAHQPPAIDHRSSSAGLEGHVPPGVMGSAAGGGLAPIPEDGTDGYGAAPMQMSTKASKSFARAVSDSRQGSPPEGGSRMRSGAMGGGADGGDKEKGGKEKGEDDWEKGSEGGESSQSGSQAASGITGVTDATSVSELQIDSRRGRLLKALTKLLCGPMLMEPLERLRLHTYGILLFMLVTHVICYVIVQNEISECG
jgi:hypothetical protein